MYKLLQLGFHVSPPSNWNKTIFNSQLALCSFLSLYSPVGKWSSKCIWRQCEKEMICMTLWETQRVKFFSHGFLTPLISRLSVSFEWLVALLNFIYSNDLDYVHLTKTQWSWMIWPLVIPCRFIDMDITDVLIIFFGVLIILILWFHKHTLSFPLFVLSSVSFISFCIIHYTELLHS